MILVLCNMAEKQEASNFIEFLAVGSSIVTRVEHTLKVPPPRFHPVHDSRTFAPLQDLCTTQGKEMNFLRSHFDGGYWLNLPDFLKEESYPFGWEYDQNVTANQLIIFEAACRFVMLFRLRWPQF